MSYNFIAYVPLYEFSVIADAFFGVIFDYKVIS